MKVLSQIKKVALATGISLSAFSLQAQTWNKVSYLDPMRQDTFEYQNLAKYISPIGASDSIAFQMAPNPYLKIAGKDKVASIIVDISKNVLYKYDSEGNVENAYLVASGKTSTPTETGVRIVTHIERYPYRNAPKHTQRYKKPWNYGPRIICLNKIDTKTGKQSSTGEFIHGNSNPDSLGKHASKGCIRMDNEIIKQIAAVSKRGDIVVIQK